MGKKIRTVDKLFFIVIPPLTFSVKELQEGVGAGFVKPWRVHDPVQKGIPPIAESFLLVYIHVLGLQRKREQKKNP
jgi:hypothetical protein